MTSVQISTAWLDAALRRVADLEMTVSTRRDAGTIDYGALCISLHERYEIVCGRLEQTTAYFNERAEGFEAKWRWYSLAAIVLAALVSAINIFAASAVSMAALKPALATLAAILSVILGALATLSSTRRWRDRPGSVAQARDQFFRLMVFLETQWSVINPALARTREAWCEGSAILLFTVEEEGSLRALCNDDQRRRPEPLDTARTKTDA